MPSMLTLMFCLDTEKKKYEKKMKNKKMKRKKMKKAYFLSYNLVEKKSEKIELYVSKKE